MNFGSVCSGIEAASEAWESLDWKPAFVSEIADFPNRVLADKHADVPNLGNICTMKYDGNIDLLVGGTPCQSFSVAGQRGGLEDERGNLSVEFCKVLEELRPRWFVWENVPGILSSNKGQDFDIITNKMVELGYEICWRVLDSKYFGVPQTRRRVFTIGCFGKGTRVQEVLFESEMLSRNHSTG